MYNTGEDDHLVFPQNLSSGDYVFVYAADKNNVVGLIQPTSESEITPEYEIPDEDVVYTIVYDMLEYIELENGNICDDSNYSCGQEHKIYNDTYSMPGDLKQNNIDKIYIWISEPTNGEKYLMVVNNVFYLSCNR